MTSSLPPWQLTTSELEREIKALEASPDDGPPQNAHTPDGGPLGALYAERHGRAQLAAHLVKKAGQHFPDDES